MLVLFDFGDFPRSKISFHAVNQSIKTFLAVKNFCIHIPAGHKCVRLNNAAIIDPVTTLRLCILLFIQYDFPNDN